MSCHNGWGLLIDLFTTTWPGRKFGHKSGVSANVTSFANELANKWKDPLLLRVEVVVGHLLLRINYSGYALNSSKVLILEFLSS
jgi:hypothetical protein